MLHVRDRHDNFVVVKGVNFSCSTNLVDKEITIREGLRYFLDNNFYQIIIESNLLTMINILNEE